MSLDPIATTDITEPNNEWGMCGFMSVLTALHEQHRLPGPVMKGHMRTRLLAEVKSYLVELEDRNPTLFKEIDRFQTKFGADPLKTFIAKVRSMGAQNKGDDPSKYVGEHATVAMTVDGLLDYLNHQCGVKAMLSPKTDHYPAIVGLINGQKELRHWVYRDGPDSIFNYGETASLQAILGHQDLDKRRSIGYVIVW